MDSIKQASPSRSVSMVRRAEATAGESVESVGIEVGCKAWTLSAGAIPARILLVRSRALKAPRSPAYEQGMWSDGDSPAPP